mgnify:CR=1 FL=1
MAGVNDESQEPAAEVGEPAGDQGAEPVGERGDSRSQRPTSEAFRSFVASGWAPAESPPRHLDPSAPFAAARRQRIGEEFPGERLVIPAGTLVTRSNDTDHRFRAHSAFAHLTGIGASADPDSVLVLHPLAPDADASHEAILYFRPRAGRDSEEFYGDARYGELWVGARPDLADVAGNTGIRCAPIEELAADLASAGPAEEPPALRVVAGADPSVDALVRDLCPDGREQDDAALAEALSELRLVKDPFEIEQLRLAVGATIAGFEDVVRALPRALAHSRGERVIETTFGARAREDGNSVGYETIAAAGDHACTLHWIRNDGPVAPGSLVLLDAGVVVESLYTADVTRTLPISGTFSPEQRRVYEAVLAAADAAFAAAVPGSSLRDVHAAAMAVLADRLHEWGWLPVPAAESLEPGGQFHRRWMVHGTSHHLGIDVHDCAQTRRDVYLGGPLRPGMVFTIEPGLYLKADDLLVPAEYRGIGVRIEDDVLVTEDGNENLTAALPRAADDVEAWMARLLATGEGARQAAAGPARPQPPG